MRVDHICERPRTCNCYQLASEPREDCPVHGAGEWPPRCAYCGHFMKWPQIPTLRDARQIDWVEELDASAQGLIPPALPALV